ncbi:MAG TPA: hypothetical protein PKA63_13070 [Oligoflexia bacterium]|mgnify:CR=1 FL=1|nr:hypothetical protein [Oligoflexia bacterium]HMP49591.1 hypothetical protein [Oligoflexia bacterium]
MKIAFIGKGGSGKTSIASSFIRWSMNKNKFTIAFDVDINKHLGDALDIDVSGSELIPRVKEIFDFLEPDRPELIENIGERPIIGCLPVASSSKLISCSNNDPVIKKFSIFKDNLAIFTAGTYSEADIGKACYHGKLFGSQLIAHRIKDNLEDTIVFDTTAGTDPVATSLIIAYDMHIVVVEPTLKSTQVFKDYLIATEGVRRGPIFVLVNKIRNEKDRKFILENIPEDQIIGEIPFSRSLKLFEQGERKEILHFVHECDEVFSKIDKKLRSIGSPNRNEYEVLLQKWFKAYSAKWFDNLYNKNLGDITANYSSFPA